MTSGLPDLFYQRTIDILLMSGFPITDHQGTTLLFPRCFLSLGWYMYGGRGSRYQSNTCVLTKRDDHDDPDLRQWKVKRRTNGLVDWVILFYGCDVSNSG